MNVAAHKQRPPLHPLERMLVGLLCGEGVFLPWAFGTMHAWSQLVVCSLAALAFVTSLWPRMYTGNLVTACEFRLAMWPRLLRFTPFWLGLGILLLLLVQSLNPAWVFQTDAKAWWMRRVAYIEWLPSSARSPFERYNIWRSFLIYSAAWLSICAVWVGITRRRSLQWLFGILVGNAVVLACVGFVQRMMKEPRVLWIRTFKDASGFSSFVYQNHGGAYFGLLAALGLALAAWYLLDGRRRMARSTSAPVWLLATMLLFFAVIFSLSRGAVITVAVFAVAAVVALAVIRTLNPVRSTTPAIVNILVFAAFATALIVTAHYVDFNALTKRFEEMAALRSSEASVAARTMARSAAWDMYQQHWLLGTGAGSFRYLYTLYVQRYPEIYEGGRSFWEHAHIDLLEIPIELGLTGVLLIAACFGWWLRRFQRNSGWRHPIAIMVLLGCCQTLLHAAIDFPFQNPAVLITWWMLLIGSLRWLELDSDVAGPPHGAPCRADLSRG